MRSRLLAKQEAERPFLLIGIAGSLSALASFFLLPLLAFGGGMGSIPLHTVNLWDSLRQRAPESTTSLLLWALMALLPACAGVTLVIACAAWFGPLPRLAVHGYTLAMLVGLLVLGGTLCISILYVAQWGFLGLGAGYLAILVGRSAFAREGASSGTPKD